MLFLLHRIKPFISLLKLLFLLHFIRVPCRPEFYIPTLRDSGSHAHLVYK